MSEPRQYELMYVISPEVSEDGVVALNAQVDEVVGGLGGRVEKTDNWGRRRLAYKVHNHREGTYVVSLIEGPGEIVSELDRKLRVLDSVLRHLVVRVDEDLRKAERARQKRLSRRVRRGRPGAAARPSTAETPAPLEGVAAPPREPAPAAATSKEDQ